jgi:hypothetical protein
MQSRSFVEAFLQMLYCSAVNLTQSVEDINNSSVSVSSATRAAIDVGHPGLDSNDDFAFFTTDGLLGGMSYVIASDEKGIVIGTGNTALAPTDYKLATQIAHGSGSGEMIHYGCWGLNFTSGAGVASFDVERIFRNDSGGAIVVAECGIYAATAMASSTPSAAKAFCIVRDLVSPTKSIGDGEYFKIKYTVQVSN